MMSHRSLFALLPVGLFLALGAVAVAQDKDKPHAKPTDTKPMPAEKMAKEEPAASLVLGKPAPDFELKDINGKAVKLSDYKGKIVVLEWFNPQCPFIVYSHGEKGPLRDMASTVAADGIVWLSINSSAPGKEGAGLELNKKMGEEWKIKNPILLDESGTVGMKYGAKTTPHMYIIDAKGNLAYRGALDNAPMGNVDGDAKMNYVQAAIADIKAGRPVAKPETKSYGCSVKYAKPGA
jgi:peroxiredoxin